MDAATNASAVTGSAGATASSGAPDPVTAVERPGSLPTRAESAAAAKDRTLTSPAAVERARAALGEITEPLSVSAWSPTSSSATWRATTAGGGR